MSSLEENFEICEKCVKNSQCLYLCIICDKIFCVACVENAKQLCSNCSNILILRDKNKSEESLKEYFTKEDNLDNFVKMVRSMNNYLLKEKEKIIDIELKLKDKEKLIFDQKIKIDSVTKNETNVGIMTKSSINNKNEPTKKNIQKMK